MFSVLLLTDDRPVPFALVDSDSFDEAAELLDTIALSSVRSDGGAMSRVALSNFAAADMLAERTRSDFDFTAHGFQLSDGDRSVTVPVASGFCDHCDRPRRIEMANVPRDPGGQWCKGAQCQGTGSFDVKVGQQQSPAQVAAARADLAGQIAGAPVVGDERAAVLNSVDQHSAASTMAEHDMLPGDNWTAERSAEHDAIVDSWMSHPGVRADRQAVMIGGPPGAGKSSALAHPDSFHTGRKTGDEFVDSEGFLHVDPDAVKQQMLDRGMVTRVPGMSDGEHAALLHEESSYLTGRILTSAESRGYNIVIDKTMSSPPTDEIRTFRASGYSMKATFVAVPVEESLGSADRRWRNGGRYVPAAYIERSRLPGGKTVNQEAFESVASQFDEWNIIDNTGISTGNPRYEIIASGTGAGLISSASIQVFRMSSPFTATATADGVVEDRTVKVDPAQLVAVVEDLGQRPSSSDLTLIEVTGHPNMFRKAATNPLRRCDMPQIESEHFDAFAAFLAGRGVKVKTVRIDPAMLWATQNQLDGRKVGKMVRAIRQDRLRSSEMPLWVSSDDFVLDGHHRWAAEAILSVGEHERTLTVFQASAPMSQLVIHARDFTMGERVDGKHHGMAARRVALTVSGPISFAVPRAGNGTWCKGAGCQAGNHTSPGMKAAHTKRMKKEAAAAEFQPEDLSQMPPVHEIQGMEKIGGPLGSNGGGWHRETDGQRYLVKPAPSREHAENELASQMLYRQLDVPVDDTAIAEVSPGKWVVAKKAIQDDDGSLGSIVGNNMTSDLQVQAQQGFAADALASSWDAYGMSGDNILESKGTLYRIDVGGSMQYRAMGSDKPSFAPGKAWGEPDSLRTSNQGRKLYGNMSDQQAAFQLSKLSTFNVGAYDQSLRNAGVSDKVRTRAVATVRDRIENQLPGIIDRLS